jgi:hypothetical protein
MLEVVKIIFWVWLVGRHLRTHGPDQATDMGTASISRDLIPSSLITACAATRPCPAHGGDLVFGNDVSSPHLSIAAPVNLGREVDVAFLAPRRVRVLLDLVGNVPDNDQAGCSHVDVLPAVIDHLVRRPA